MSLKGTDTLSSKLEIIQSDVQIESKTTSLKMKKSFLAPGNYWKGVVTNTDLK